MLRINKAFRSGLSTLLCFGFALIPFIIGCGGMPDTETQQPVSKIIFTVQGEAGTDIYIMDPDGSNQMPLFQASYTIRQPVWSPDGTKILYSGREDEGWEAFIINPDGSNNKKIPNSMGVNDGAWTNDNQTICYTGQTEKGRGLITLRIDGTGRTLLPTGSDNDAYSTWSSSVSKIAFESGRDGNPEIYAMNGDGSGSIRLTDNSNLDEWPSVSPDGMKIAYASGIEEDKDIWIVNMDGTNRVQITNDVTIGDAFSSWSPDGTQIVFTTASEGVDPELFMVKIDGTGLTKIADGAFPSWSPYLK